MSRGYSAREGATQKYNGYRLSSASASYSDAKLRAAEKDLAARPGIVEHLYALDKDGNVLFDQAGEDHMVRMTREQNSLLVSQNGDAVITHNHPTGKSFSVVDVIAMLGGNLAEIRAVGREWTYSMSDPGAKFRERFARYEPLFGETKEPMLVAKINPLLPDQFKQETREFVTESVEEKIFDKLGLPPNSQDDNWVTGPDDLTPEATKAQEEWDRKMEQEVSHVMMTKFAKEYGLTYKRFKTNP
jgi:hypothetical protein